MNDNTDRSAARLAPQTSVSGHENHRETGARKFPAKDRTDALDDFSQDAALKKPPLTGIGLTEASSDVQADVNEKTRHSDGQNPSAGDRRSDGSERDVAEHSKDAHTQDVGKPRP